MKKIMALTFALCGIGTPAFSGDGSIRHPIAPHSVCVHINSKVLHFTYLTRPYGVLHYEGAAFELIGNNWYARNKKTRVTSTHGTGRC